MTIVTTVRERISLGNKKMILGTSVLSGSTATGDVAVPLKNIVSMQVTVLGAAQQGSSVDETFPTKDTDPTVLVETNDSSFDWVAIGY